MRLHSDIHTWSTIREALDRAKAAGHVSPNVHIEESGIHGSRKRKAAIEIKLGTYVKIKGDGRRYVNTGNRGADAEAGLYAATYDEWGWFIAELFAADPEATFGNYDGVTDFDSTTRFKFILPELVSTGSPVAG